MRVSVVIDSADPPSLAEFWRAALGYRRAGELPGYVVLAPPAGESAPGRPVVVLQRVDESGSGRVDKNRLHLDLHCDDVPEALDRLESLGARRSGPPVTELLDTVGIWWQVMHDPEGNVFCLVADAGPRPD